VVVEEVEAPSICSSVVVVVEEEEVDKENKNKK